MPGKRKSAKSGSSRGSSGKKKGKKSARSAKSSSAKSGTSSMSLRDPDIMDEPAMFNLYYIAHGPVEALEIRGFGWTGAAPGKKGKGKKGKKKK